jgi:short-subunit dehydrogenase
MSLRVIITGASSGIGAALARQYAAQGAALGLISRRLEALSVLRETLSSAPVSTYATDVRDANGMARAAADFLARHGGVDIVIASAGVSAGTLTERSKDRAVFQEIFDSNVLGMVNTFAPFIEPMRAAGRGTLVGIASVAGFRGLPGSGAYSASKAAVIAYLESLRIELRSFDLAVTTICPGYVATPMTQKNPYPMPFLLAPDEAARRMVRAIAQRKRHVVIPWQMAIVGVVLKAMPRPLYDALFAKAPRKPRREG